MIGMVLDVTEANFQKEVIESKVPVVVDFWATWCQPCKLLTPIIDELSGEYDGSMKFFKMDVDSNEDVVAKYNIMSIPALLLFENGEVKSMNVGAVPKEKLRTWIDSNL